MLQICYILLLLNLNHCILGNIFLRKQVQKSRIDRQSIVQLQKQSSILIDMRGGNSINGSESFPAKWSIRETIGRNVLGCWGVLQVVSILGNGLKRLIPIAMQPFIQKDISPFHWTIYGLWVIYMAYAEGYKGFQLKFAPLVVERAFSIANQPTVLNCILAGPYSMGLFGASNRRLIISWSITLGVYSIVRLVKMLPYPYRSIIDGGVVTGLTYGVFSICWFSIQRLLGRKTLEIKD